MPASPSTLAFLRAAVPAAEVTRAVREALVDKALVLPCDIADAERDDLWDLVTGFADLEVQIVAHPVDLLPERVCLVTEPVDADPVPPSGSIVLAVRRQASGRRRMIGARALRLVRESIVTLLGVHGRGPRSGQIADWAQQVTDSPSTALRFAAAAHAVLLSRPRAPDGEVVAEGLAAVIAWLLWNVDPRTAEWVLASALPSRSHERLVSPQAAILGEEAALLRALAAGLIEHLPEEPGDALDLRRPFAVLRDLGDISAEIGLGLVVERLKPRLGADVFGVIDRWQHLRPKPIRLAPPLRKRDFLGRDELMARLEALLEPGHEVRTAVLYGMHGLGKSAIGAALCERLAGRLEPVWLTFNDGPEPAWRRVADALGVESKYAQEERRKGPVPRWIEHVHARLAERDVLVVIDDAQTVAESDLPIWLPKGPGRCVVLVLSTRAERVLHRENDAIAVALRPLQQEEARTLLVGKVPALEAGVERGELDELLERLGGHPSAIGWAAALLQKRSVIEVSALVEQGPDALRKLAKQALDALDEEETRIVEALSVAAPTGSPRGLLARMIDGSELGPVLQRLADRAVLELGAGTVRMQGVIALAIETGLPAERRRALEASHARAVDAVMRAARLWTEGDEATRDAAHADAMLALERMIDRCERGDDAAAETVSRLAFELAAYPRGERADVLRRVIRAYELLLTKWTAGGDPERWARTQDRLGRVLRSCPVGSRKENLQRAVAAHEAALTVLTRDAHPAEWAEVQINLGAALAETPAGERADNLVRAIRAYEAALTVSTLESAPERWADLQNSLGSALAALPTGDRKENRRRAIEAYERALTVYTPVSSPLHWAAVHYNLGGVLRVLTDGDRAENVRRAIEAYEQVLMVYLEDTVPSDWAMTQNALGNAWATLPGGDPAGNLCHAIDAYESALSVYTREAFPWDWAGTQHNLGLAFSKLENAHRRENLQFAMDAFRSALKVYTKEDFPREHARTTAALEKAVAALAALPSTTEPPSAGPAEPGDSA